MRSFFTRCGCALGVSIALFGCKPKTTLVPMRVVLTDVTLVGPGKTQTRTSQQVAWSDAAIGQPIDPNGAIKTGPGGPATITVDSATTVELGDQTIVGFQSDARGVVVTSGHVVVERLPVAAADPTRPRASRMYLGSSQIDLAGDAAMLAVIEADQRGGGEVHVERGELRITNAGAVVTAHAGETFVLVHDQAPDPRAQWKNGAPPLAGALTRERIETAPTTPRGLGTMTGRAPGTTDVISGVRLASHHVKTTVRDGFARTEIEEEFANDTTQVLEGQYVFPVPAAATLTRLALWVGDKLVEGEIEEKNRAKTIFKGIVEDTVRPRDPALLEWRSGGSVSLKVFPLPAKGSRKVILAYDEVLRSESGTGRLVLPLALGADRALTIADFTVDVTVTEGDKPVTELAAAGLDATIGKADGTAHFAAKNFAPSADFALTFARPSAATDVALYAPTAADFPVAKADPEDPDAYVALRLRATLPDATKTPEPKHRDVVFVLDRSRSVPKETLADAARVIGGALRRLGDDERFAILACDSACDAFPPEGLDASGETNVAAVGKWLTAITPGGSSDVAGSLVSALRRGAASHAQIVYLGEGAPSSGELRADHVAERVRTERGEGRVDFRFFGAGSGADEPTLRTLASVLGGTYDPLADGSVIADRAATISDDLRHPVLVAPTLKLPAAITRIEPAKLPNLRLGQEIVVVGRLRGAPSGDATIEAELDGAPYVVTQPLVFPTTGAAQNPLVPPLWASLQIAGLQGKEAVAMSKRFHVLSRETSFLVLENDAMFSAFGVTRTAGNAAPKDASFATPGADPLLDLAQKTPAVPGGASAGSGFGSGAGRSGGFGSLGGGAAAPRGDAGVSSSIQAPRANVAMSTPSVSGAIPPAVVFRIARQNIGRYRICYQRGLALDPGISGMVIVRFVIGPSGEVTTSNTNGPIPPEIGQCLATATRALSFPQPEGGGSVQVNLPLRLLADGEGPSQPRLAPPSHGFDYPHRPSAPTPSFVIRPGDDGFMTAGEDALEKLRVALAAMPTSRKREEALIRGLLARGRSDEASTSAAHFVDIDPDSSKARELDSYAAALAGRKADALRELDAMSDLDAPNVNAHIAAAKGFETGGDEGRACAHWRAVAELRGKDGDVAEALRCRARVWGGTPALIAEARAIDKPGPRVTAVIPTLDKPSAWAENAATSAGDVEAKITCADEATCPVVVIVSPTGRVFSPWTPSSARAGAHDLAIVSPANGTHHFVVIGGTGDGELTVRGGDSSQKIALHGPHGAVAALDVSSNLGLGGIGALIGLGNLDGVGAGRLAKHQAIAGSLASSRATTKRASCPTVGPLAR